MEIDINDIIIRHKNLKNSSLEFLSQFFKSDKYPDLPSDIESILIRKKKDYYYLANGRHRLFLSRAYGVKRIPAFLFDYNASPKNSLPVYQSITIINYGPIAQ